MTDFVNLLITMRQGQVAADIGAKFNEVVAAVLESGGKGEITVKFTIKPNKMALGGAVVEVKTEHDVKLKKPELKIGESVFFVSKDGALTRDDPKQTQMFDQEGADARP